jgi:cytoskeletal protein CcmA (bactofilin family)
MALWNQSTQDGTQEKTSDKVTPLPVTPVPPPMPAAATMTAPTAPAPTPKEQPARDRRESVFGRGVSIEGKIEGDADVRIGGKFKGDIQIKGDLTVEKGAQVAAKIHVASVTIAGTVDGNVTAAAHVNLLDGGQLVGDLKAASLTVAAGSRMRGNVEFGWSATESAKFANGRAHEDEKAGTVG